MNVICPRFLLATVMSFALSTGAALAHSGDNEKFNSSEVTGPTEVSVDAQGIEALGIKTRKASLQTMRESLKATGDVQADEARAFNVNPPMAGLVKEVFVKQGDMVRKGQTLAVIHSVEIANTLSQLLNERTKVSSEIARTKTQYTSDITLQNNQLNLTIASLQREEALLKEGISARKNYIEAKNNHESAIVKLDTLKQRLKQEVSLLEKQLSVTTATAKEQLKIMGLSEAVINSALSTGKATANLHLLAPVSGCVIKREITLGESVAPDKSVFQIVNLSPIWVMVDIFQEQIPMIREGQEVLLQTPSKSHLTGRISSVGSVIDPATKTLHVRISSDNRNGELRPGMFVTAEILLGQGNRNVLSVPESALVYYKDKPYVYEHHIDEGHFEPSPVTLGEKTGGQVEIVSGLHEGDLIVISGASQLLAQAVLKPAAEEGHENEKHGDHDEHEAKETPTAGGSAQLIMGLGLGIGLTLLMGLIWILTTKLRKSREVR